MVTMRAQNGSALIIFMVTIMTVLTVFVGGWYHIGARQQNNADDANRRAYIEDVRGRIDLWYRQNLGTADSDANSGQIDVDAILTNLGIIRRYNLIIRSSNRILQDGVGYHVIAMWLPLDTADTTTLDINTGNMTVQAGTVHAVVNGFPIQSEARTLTRKRLDNVVAVLESFFNAGYLSDTDRRTDINYYRAAACGSPSLRELPCVDTYDGITESGISAKVGLAGQYAIDAWGQEFQMSNLLDSETAASPFTMSIKSTMPWGGTLGVVATQP